MKIMLLKLILFLVVYNFFILSNSKLHLLKGVDMMLRNLDVSALRLNYIDTGNFVIISSNWNVTAFILDSMVLSMSKPSLDDMVLPGKEKSWEYHKKKWFVMDESQIREPGEKI